MNPLPLIAEFLAQNPHGGYADMSRAALRGWLTGKVADHMIDLAADAMIAAGIGREQEQIQTVYCRVSYG